MKTIGNYFFLTVLLTASASADDDFIRYFNEFYHEFSSASMSEQRYTRLVSFRVKPSYFLSYGKDSVESYVGETDEPRTIAEKNEILFNGRVAKRFFLKYLAESVLSGRGISPGNNVDYKEAGATYTFNVDKKESDKVVLYENILFPVGDDNYSQYSCFYDFSKSKEGVVKLVDVVCAG